jgi:drug/metabolite transporter (DMT)-like permease
MHNSRLKAYAALIANVIIWGAALPIVKPALETLSPFAFLFYRYAIASLIMIPVFIWFWPKFKQLNLKQWAIIGAIEFLQLGVGLSFLYVGLEYTSALSAALIGSTSPILVVIGGIIFLKEHQEKREWVGLGISVIGTLLVILGPFLAGGSNGQISHFGNLMVVLYVISWMAYSLLAKKYFADIDKLVIASVSCIVGLMSFALISPLLTPLPSFTSFITSGYPFLATVYMGTLGSSVAIGLFLYGQSKIEASEAALFTYLQPLIYIPLSVWWLGDHILPLQIIGLTCISAGVFIAEKRKRFKPAS